jgi:Pirin C-terminal cupin domain
MTPDGGDWFPPARGSTTRVLREIGVRSFAVLWWSREVRMGCEAEPMSGPVAATEAAPDIAESGRPEGPTVELVPSRHARVGGRPFTEDLLMWWNFVGRTGSEIEQAWTEWEHGTARFGPVASDLGRIPAPRPGWLPTT